MKKFILLLIFGLLLMVSLPSTASVAVDTGDQITMIVDSPVDVPSVQGVVQSICIDTPPPLIYTCGVSIDPVAEGSFVDQLWTFLKTNSGYIFAILWAISEMLASSKLKSNGIFQFFQNWLKKRAKPIS